MNLTENIKIAQRRASNRCVFLFEKDCLNFTLSDSTATHNFRIPYEEINLERYRTFETKRSIWFFVGGLWIAAGLAEMIFDLRDKGSLEFPTWFILGLMAFGYHYYVRTKFQVIDVSQGSIYIIADKKKDQILAKITEYRKSSLKERYARILNELDPAGEAARFEFLRRESIISQDEYVDLMAELQLRSAAMRPEQGQSEA